MALSRPRPGFNSRIGKLHFAFPFYCLLSTSKGWSAFQGLPASSCAAIQSGSSLNGDGVLEMFCLVEEAGRQAHKTHREKGDGVLLGVSEGARHASSASGQTAGLTTQQLALNIVLDVTRQTQDQSLLKVLYNVIFQLHSTPCSSSG
jgi:hypothetical protein